MGRLGVKRRGRFVQQQDRGVMQEGPNQRDPLAHALGVFRQPAILIDLEGKLGQQPRGPFLANLCRETVQGPKEVQVLSGPHPRVEAVLLGENPHNPTHFLGVFEEIKSPHPGSTAGRSKDPSQHADRGGFPGSIWPEQRQDFSAPYAKRQAINPAPVAEPLAQTPGLNHSLAHGP